MSLSNDQIEIRLKVDIADLKDIYFGNREHVYFFGPKTKAQSLGLVCAFILCPIILFHAISVKGGISYIFSIIGFFSAVGAFWSAVRPIIKWKKSVTAFLENAEQVKNLKVIFNNEFIHHIQDETETKLNWSIIERAIITNRFIELDASTSIFLAKSSMTQEEYRILSDKIMEKVQEVQKN